jgi:glutamyl-tRNA reductase
VVSATASPNFTLRQELFEPVTLTRPLILMDLAVPRDVEPSIGNMKGITLYDMDSFKSERSHEQMEQLHEAHQIVAAQVDEFIKWFEGRDIMPRIEKIKEAAAHDLMVRLDRPVGKLLKDEQLQREVETSVETSAVKMVNKLIFGLRDEVSPEAFLACVTALEKLYEN